MEERHVRQAAKRIVSSFLARVSAFNFAVGDVVKSEYQARWFGVIVEVIEREEQYGPLLEVIVTHDRHGNLARKPFYKRISAGWLKPAPEMYAEVTARAKSFGYRF
jgi:hypothetical protein